jgi:hypothetical protein
MIYTLKPQSKTVIQILGVSAQNMLHLNVFRAIVGCSFSLTEIS